MGSTHKMWIGSVSLAVLLIASGILLGNQRLAYASVLPPGFGSQIVCQVFSDLNVFGTPIPHLNAEDCPNSPPFGGGTLKVMKIVVGGTASPSDFQIHVKSDGRDVSGSPQPGSPGGTSYIGLAPGSYVVSEDATSTYDTSFSGNCNSSGDVSVTSSNIPVTCTMVNTFHAPSPSPENTLALCSDGIDNDGDGKIDLADPDCAAFIPPVVASSTLQIIKHVINDNGGTKVASNFTINVAAINAATSSFPGSESTTTVVVDPGTYAVTESADAGYAASMSSDCSGTLAAGETKTCTIVNDDIAPVITSDGNDSPPGGGSPTPHGGGELPATRGGGGPIGQVLGASTSTPGAVAANCGALLSGYLRKGIKNDSNEVKKLQEFLNVETGANLPVTGFFGSLTHAAVNTFQLKYADDVLKPWLPYGLPNAKTPTGYVYKTTQRKVNLLHCSSLSIPLPQLP